MSATRNKARYAPRLLRMADGGWRIKNEHRRWNPQSTIRPPQFPRAFTLLEAVISTVIVAIMLVTALNTVGASRLTQHKAALVSRGRMLAESLLAEILEQAYQEASEPRGFGPETGESGTNRAAFDDVDDYQGWSESPPAAKDGTALPNAANWRRTVTVEWVDPLNPKQVRGTETSVKRITVVAAYQNVPQATVVALKGAN